MKSTNKPIVSILSGCTIILTSVGSAAITAGIDFDVTGNGQTNTEPDFLGVPATAAKTYNVSHNGITFNLASTNNNLANANRRRGQTGLTSLTRDFLQFYGNTTSPVEGTLTLSGLAPNTDYEVSFFTYNAGAGQTTHSFYEGSSVATGTLLSTFTTSGSWLDPANWTPNVDYTLQSDASGEIVVTIEAPIQSNGSSRLTLDGVSVTIIPEPSSISLLVLSGFALTRRLRR